MTSSSGFAVLMSPQPSGVDTWLVNRILQVAIVGQASILGRAPCYLSKSSRQRNKREQAEGMDGGRKN
jgi:hypothetical protein